jgi:galactonate dehydratase
MAMRIARFEHLHADAGWRIFSFLKIVTDDGLGGGPRTDESDADLVSVQRD